MVFKGQQIKILIVARDGALRNGLQALLGALFPVGEIDLVDSEAAAVEAFQRTGYDLVILYPSLPVPELLSTARRAMDTAPQPCTLWIAEDQNQMSEAQEAGIDQAILIGFSIDELTMALKKLLVMMDKGTGARQARSAGL